MWDKDWALKWENWRELQWKKWLSWCSVCLSAQSTDLSTQTLRFARGTRWDFSCLPSGETSEGRARLWAPRHQTMHPNIISIQSPNLIPLFPRHAPIFEMKGDKKKQVTPPHRLLSLLLNPLFLHQENRNQDGRLGGERDASIAIQSHSTLHVNPLHRQGLLSVQRWTAIKMMGYDRFIDVSLRFFDFIKVHGAPSLALDNSYLWHGRRSGKRCERMLG